MGKNTEPSQVPNWHPAYRPPAPAQAAPPAAPRRAEFSSAPDFGRKRRKRAPDADAVRRAEALLRGVNAAMGVPEAPVVPAGTSPDVQALMNQNYQLAQAQWQAEESRRTW